MKRVPLHGKPQGYVEVEPRATVGAVVGLNLRWPDGRLVTEAELVAAIEVAERAAAVNPANPVGTGASYTDAQADARVAAGIATHVAAEDPHEQYATTEEVAAAIAAIPRGVLPLVTGAIVSGQPQFVYAGDGSLIYAEIA